MNFNALETKNKLVQWIRDWFAVNGPESPAVIGISGGKDSSVVAALCVEALGKDRVVGVMMPNGVQPDISDSERVINHLDIAGLCVNIKDSVDAVKNSLGNFEFTKQATENLPPRIRMTTLYAVSQCLDGRVANTCNLSETMIGWETRWGDAVGDFAPLADLTVQEVIAVGLECDLPKDLVVKVPSDGLCGKTDEDAIGFKYSELDGMIRGTETPVPEVIERISKRVRNSEFKRKPIPKFESGLVNNL